MYIVIKVQQFELQGGENVVFDYAKLKGRITEIYGSQSAFAKAMELSERSISLKLNGHVPFSQPEISRALTLLNLDGTQASDYFFALKVQ